MIWCYLIYNPLHQIKLPLQRRVQQQSQRVKLHSQTVAGSLRRRLLQVGSLRLRRRGRGNRVRTTKQRTLYVCTPSQIHGMPTLGSEGGAGGDGEGEAWPIESCAGLDPLLLLLFWSSGLSGDEAGLVWAGGDAATAVSTFAAVSLGVSIATEGGDKRRELAFRFCTSPAAVPTPPCLSPASTFPLAEWMLSISPKRQSGW